MNRPVFPTFAMLLSLPLFAPAAEPEWPQWRGPKRDNVWPGRDFPQRLPAKLPSLWTKPLGAGYGGVAISGGRVYVMDRQTTPVDIERVVCLDLDNGETKWVRDYSVSYKGVDYGNGPRSTPTIYDGRVYTLGTVGHLHCLDATNGEVIWSHDCVKEFAAKLPTWGLACSPFIDGDRVVVQVGGENACAIAFDRKTGKVVWKSLPDRCGYTSPVLIETDGRKLLIVWTAQNINALEPETGKLVSAVPFAITYDVAIADPVWHDGILLCGQYWEGSKALRYVENGEKPVEVWAGKRLRLLMATPLVRDGFAYALDREHGLMCVDLKTGEMKWKDYRISYDKQNPPAAPLWVGDGRAAFLNEKGEFIVAKLSPKGHEELGRAKVFDGSWAHPGLARDRMVERDDKQIICVKLAGE